MTKAAAKSTLPCLRNMTTQANLFPPLLSNTLGQTWSENPGGASPGQSGTGPQKKQKLDHHHPSSKENNDVTNLHEDCTPSAKQSNEYSTKYDCSDDCSNGTKNNEHHQNASDTVALSPSLLSASPSSDGSWSSSSVEHQSILLNKNEESKAAASWTQSSQSLESNNTDSSAQILLSSPTSSTPSLESSLVLSSSSSSVLQSQRMPVQPLPRSLLKLIASTANNINRSKKYRPLYENTSKHVDAMIINKAGEKVISSSTVKEQQQKAAVLERKKKEWAEKAKKNKSTKKSKLADLLDELMRNQNNKATASFRTRGISKHAPSAHQQQILDNIVEFVDSGDDLDTAMILELVDPEDGNIMKGRDVAFYLTSHIFEGVLKYDKTLYNFLCTEIRQIKQYSRIIVFQSCFGTGMQSFNM
jgi:hypothetical protein